MRRRKRSQVSAMMIFSRNQDPDVAERIVELCAILLPILTKLEGSSRAVAFLQISLIKAQVELFTSGSKEVILD